MKLKELEICVKQTNDHIRSQDNSKNTIEGSMTGAAAATNNDDITLDDDNNLDFFGKLEKLEEVDDLSISFLDGLIEERVDRLLKLNDAQLSNDDDDEDENDEMYT